MNPSAPALATAATSGAVPTHCIPPWTIGCSTPNASVNLVLNAALRGSSSLSVRAEAHPHGVGLKIGVEAGAAVLATEPGFLVAAERCTGVARAPTVDVHRSCLKHRCEP